MNKQDNEKSAAQRGDSSGTVPSDAERRIREDAGALAETAKSELANIKSDAEEEMGALAEEGKRRIGEAADQAKGFATEQKDMFADQLGGVASAMHKVADELRTENATTAGYADKLADGMDKFTRDLRSRDADGLVSMAEDFGRRQPAAFMACAAIAGFAASRFLRASAARRNGDAGMTTAHDYGHTASGYGSTSSGSMPNRNTDTMGRPYQ